MSESAMSGKRATGQIILGGILVVLCLGILLYNLKWVKSVLSGPVPITLSELRKVESPAALSNQWVSFTFDKSEETDVGIETTRGGRTNPRSRFLLIQVEDRWLLADVPHNFSGKQVVGYLDSWWVPLRKKSMDAVTASFPTHQQLPFQIDAQYAQTSECYSLLGVVGFFLIVGLVVVWLGFAGKRGGTQAATQVDS